MVRIYINSLIFIPLVFLISTVTSVQIQNRYSLGDKFTYAENKTSTTVDLLTGEETIEQEETIYTEHVVELEDLSTNASAEIEKTYSFVRLTPPNERTTRRLLSQRTRENFQKTFKTSVTQYSVGDRWATEGFAGVEGHSLVTRIHENDEYDTEIITVDMEILGTVSALNYGTPLHSWTTRNIDVETGILLSEETIRKMTVIYERKTDITVKKLIKRETGHHEF